MLTGPKFNELENHLLIINKALYGLWSSGLRWHEKLADILRGMGFVPSKGENDIWMQRNGEVYEYIACYVDLCIVAKDPKEITDLLLNKYGYKLKGTGPISYHLGCDYFRDKDNNVEDKMCLGNEREEIKLSTSSKGDSQVGRQDNVTDATPKNS